MASAQPTSTGFIPLPPSEVQTALLDWVLGVVPGTQLNLVSLTEFLHNQDCTEWVPQQTTSRILSRLRHDKTFCMYIDKDKDNAFWRVDRTAEPSFTDQLFGTPKVTKKRSVSKKPYRTLKQRFGPKKLRETNDGFTTIPIKGRTPKSLGKMLTLIKKEDLPDGLNTTDLITDLELDVNVDGGVSDDDDCEGGIYND